MANHRRRGQKAGLAIRSPKVPPPSLLKPVHFSPESIFPGAPWLDTDGKLIQAQGGGILHDAGVYYWFGENKDAETLPGRRVDVIGVNCYSSRDLVAWKNEGLVLPAVPGDPSHDMHPGKVAERPKVIFNPRTRKYVMWLHIDSPDYTAARAGVAVSDCVTGPHPVSLERAAERARLAVHGLVPG